MHLFQTTLLFSFLLFTGCGTLESTQQEEGSTFSSDLKNTIDYKTKFINENTCNLILDKVFLEICYDTDKKVAKSVSYTLYGDLVNELNIQERPSFYEEESIDEEHRAKVGDYTHSGYDRGHLAPDASFDWSQKSLEATYSLANIIPQVSEVNQQLWSQAEAYARDMAVELGEVMVINVMKYSTTPKLIGQSQLAVSTGYYKLILNESQAFETCLFYENSIEELNNYHSLEAHKIECSTVEY